MKKYCLILVVFAIQSWSKEISKQKQTHISHKRGKNREINQEADSRQENHNRIKKILRKVTDIEKQMQALSERLNSLTPKCKSNADCDKGSCCWFAKGLEGRCKLIPHRVNQRCTKECGCSDGMYCHLFKKDKAHNKKKHHHHKKGKCYLKDETLGMKNTNFIPNLLEKIHRLQKKNQS